MFVARDQENVIRGPHGSVPAKVLGNGTGGIKQNPKTPGKALFTPIAPRTNRAPLGEKTNRPVNFKTPGQPSTGAGLLKTQKRSSGKRPKLKVHQPTELQIEANPDTIEQEDENEVPEIEYCPPKIQELPDEPDDMMFGKDYDFSHLQDFHNQSLGLDDIWEDEIGEDGLSRYERQQNQKHECFDARINHEILAGIQENDPENWTPMMEKLKQEAKFRQEELENKYFGGKASIPIPDPQKKSAKSPPSTISAKTAAVALSQQPQPRFAAPTIAARARQRDATRDSDEPVKRNVPNAASRSTVGYAKGRRMAATLRPIVKEAIQPTKNTNVDKQAELLRKLTFMQEDQEDIEPLFEDEEESDAPDWLEQAFGSFQFTIPHSEDEDEQEAYDFQQASKV